MALIGEATGDNLPVQYKQLFATDADRQAYTPTATDDKMKFFVLSTRVVWVYAAELGGWFQIYT